MTTHSSVLAWRIPGTGSLVGCCLWGCTESDTTEATWQQQMALVVKNPPVNAGRSKRCGFDPWVGKIPRGGHGNPLQYSCLENPWRGIPEESQALQEPGVHRVP